MDVVSLFGRILWHEHLRKYLEEFMKINCDMCISFFFCYSHKVPIIAYKINSVPARLINNLVNDSQVAPTDSSDDWFIQLDQAFIKHTQSYSENLNLLLTIRLSKKIIEISSLVLSYFWNIYQMLAWILRSPGMLK